MALMSAAVQERLRLKRTTLDTWSTREKLSLASSVLRSGDQNWSCVSRNLRMFAEPNRPPDWFSQKNCAQQYAGLLENVETPKRKKRSHGIADKTEVETPGESIVRKLTAERIEELKKIMLEEQANYLRLKEDINCLVSGEADHRLDEMLQEIEDEKKQKEQEKEAHIKWLREREERKIELERAWKPGSQFAQHLRRPSSMSEASSEADSPLSEPLNVDVPEETVLTKPTPTSPLLTSLLKSPSATAQVSSILHSAITSPHRGSTPTIASLLSSAPGLPGSLSLPPTNVSSNLKNLVSNALSGSYEEHKPVPQSPSQEHLGPPPPYQQATEYLQKQKAEQQFQQQQLAMSPSLSQRQLQQELTPGFKEELVTRPVAVTPPAYTPPQAVGVRRTSIKGRKLDLSVNEAEVESSVSKVSPPKEKETKRIVHNTSDHDYTESPVKEESTNKPETDVFEFDERKEGYDKFDLMLKDSKMGMWKRQNKKDVETKQVEPKSYLKESEKMLSPVRETIKVENEEEDVPLRDLAKKVPQSPTEECVEASKQLSSPTGKDAAWSVERGDVKNVAVPAQTTELSLAEPEEKIVEQSEDVENDSVKNSNEQSEEEKIEEAEDSESAKDEETLSNIVDIIKTEKGDSATEDEKSNDTAPRSYSRKRPLSMTFSDSVPNSPVGLTTDEDKEFKAWKKSVMLVYTRIAGHRYSSLFLKPINDDLAPGYSQYVYRPVDLGSIKRNIENGNIRTNVEFQRDVMLMFQNALMYNKKNSHVYQMALSMQADCVEHFQILLQATEESVSFRRETRTQQDTKTRNTPDHSKTRRARSVSGSNKSDRDVSSSFKRKSTREISGDSVKKRKGDD